jgi:uncharacterized membrane protein
MMASLRFESVQTPWLWLLLTLAGAAVLFFTYWGMFRRSERFLAWGLMLLRGAGLLALLLLLAKPVWTNESEIVDAGRVAVVLDNSQSMSLADTGGKTRYALARDAVDRLKRALEQKRDGGRLVVDLFDINGVPLKGIPEQPTVERTDLARAVSEAATRLRSRPLAGVVLISDGMDNTGRQDFSDLAALRVPVHGVGFSAQVDAGGLDLAVRRVKAPERAMIHNEIKVDVLVAKTGGPATGATVTVKRGPDTFATQKIDFEAGNSEKLVSLKVRPTQAGSFVFTAAVESDAGEKNLANNAAHFPLQVDGEPIKVLYIEGFLRYEYKFLKDRLEDDPDVRLLSVVRRRNPDQAEKGVKDLLTADRLKDFHVVILGDMEADYLSAPEYQELVHWLDGKGHALLVLGGYRSFGPDGFRKTPLADALPVVFADSEPYQTEEPFVLQLTEDGKRHPIFELSGDRVKDAETWSKSPHLLGCCLVKEAKPGATVLAENPNVRLGGKPAVVAAVQRYGGGYTMVLTADTTWRWSRLTRVLGQSDTLYARFWSQTVRWLSGRGQDEQRPLLTVSTDRPDYEVGKPVKLRAVRQPRDKDLAGTQVGVEVRPAGGKPVAVAMTSSTAEPDVFTGTFVPQAGGRYEAAATLTGEGKPLANQTAEFLVQGSNLELDDQGTNPATLKAIKSATGGVYREVDEAEKVADEIAPKERHMTRTQRLELWNSPELLASVFAFFLLAVTGEWLIRRRNHLV